jgi:imidazolonepropionase-like amidohydrolase
MITRISHILFSLLVVYNAQAQTSTEFKTLLINGFLHVGNGEVIATAAVGIEGTDIVLIKNALAYTINEADWDTIIDVKGQHIYPGFLAPNSTLGLTEIDAVRATRDFYEVGKFNPHIRSLIAFNVESKVVATVRSNGVLFSQATPRGGVISGMSSIMHLGGWNWEDAAVKVDDGIHLNWPSITHYEWSEEGVDKKKNDGYQKDKKEIYDFFQATKSYSEKNGKDLRYEATKLVFDTEKRLYIHANTVQELLDVIDFVNHFEIPFPVIVGAYDAHLITERIKDSNIPLMLPRVHSLPNSEDDDIDLPYKLPALLAKAGIKFCLQNEGDMEAMNARNLPFLAGTAMAYGLSEEEAVRSISLNACEIVGIGKKYGSIEVGKKASLFVSKGNALDMRTNQVSLIFMDGNYMDPSNFQTELYRKYAKKLNLKVD